MLSLKETKEIKKGVIKYQLIMRMYGETDVAENRDFQRLYNGFYIMAWRSEDWYSYYYNMLEVYKNTKQAASSGEGIGKGLKIILLELCA